MELIKKATEHVQKSLNLVHTQAIYNGVKQTLDELQVPIDVRDEVILKLNDCLVKYVDAPITECKEWLRAIIHDLKTKA